MSFSEHGETLRRFLDRSNLYCVCHVSWSGQFQAGGVSPGLGPGPGLLPDLRHPGRAHPRGQVHTQAQAGGARQTGRHLLQIICFLLINSYVAFSIIKWHVKCSPFGWHLEKKQLMIMYNYLFSTKY